ncbi:monodechloroaminopyrrolnitrin synthase PrnB family protein [Streptomyces spinosus]|uniref:monodechloroaminopyrrolnitrin synthase PrnB family protein n=1 Tax=Streptomyces spinosus TaxID=2872623 RepID=UPI001CEDAF77|nr:monodechloroaminopyrrolnitrin synthase PrnB family protein [Streptomyces spinosus]
MRELDLRVAALDPLGAVHEIRRLPLLNRAADVAGLTRLARAWAGRVDGNRYDAATASAALRDIGFALASLERHGVDYRIVEGAEEILLKLGALADEVPRDSVYTYALRNPEHATRSFTELPEEALFIREVRTAGFALRPAVDALTEALPLAVDDRALPDLLAAATEGFAVFARSLLSVKRQVTPETFSYEMRPYFPPMTVGGQVLYAPGGAQMTPLLVDILLLRPEPGEAREEWYEQYLRENVGYLPAAYRVAGDRARRHRPLLPRLVEEAGREAVPTARTTRTLTALRGLMREVLKFRIPHLRLAKANMNVRPDGSLGSGGYTTDSLDHLAELTLSRHQLLSTLPAGRTTEA